MNLEGLNERLPQRRSRSCPPILRAAPRSGWLLLGLLLSASGGCGTGAYEARLDARSKNLAEEARQKAEAEQQRAQLEEKFKDMSPPRSLPGLPVTFCVPTKLDNLKNMDLKNPTPLCENGKAANGSAVDQRRALPGVDLPVPINITYEALPRLQDQAVSFYCYVGAAEMPKGKSLSDMARDVHDILAKHGSPSEVRDLPVETRTSEQRQWKMIRCEFEQAFFCPEVEKKTLPADLKHRRLKPVVQMVVDESKATYKNLPGVLEVFLGEDKGYLIMIAARMPTALETFAGGPTLMESVAKLMGGTVVVNPPTAASAASSPRPGPGNHKRRGQ